jgi:hypothetical protein
MRSFEDRDKERCDEFLSAAKSGNIESIKRLHSQGVHIDIADE